MSSIKKLPKHVWRCIRPHRGSLYALFVVWIVSLIIADIISPMVLERIVDSISASQPSQEAVWQAVWMMAIVIVSTFILFRIFDYLFGIHVVRARKDLNDYSFEQLMQHGYSFFINNFSGSLVAKVKRYVRGYQTLLENSVFWVSGSIVVMTGTVTVLFFRSTVLAWVFLAWIAVYITITIVLVRYKIRFDLAEASADSAVTADLADSITNATTVKTFATERRELGRFKKTTDEQLTIGKKAMYFRILVYAVQGSMLAILEFAGLYISIRLWSQGVIGVGTVVLVQSFVAVLFHGLWNLGKALTRIAEATADMEELVEIFETDKPVTEAEKPKDVQQVKGVIGFEDVGFSYPDGTRVLKGFQLKIPRGERVGLVGRSGAGKSTITKILLRFADVQEGSVTIDGTDIRKMRFEDLRGNIAYVPQDPILFHRTIAENIAYANPDATREEVIKAAKQAHAHEFISGLAKGYDTLVGERGVKLSGGERQRVAIARAILKDAPILVMDEATSSLDAKSERYVQDALKHLMEGRTTIVIAHRLSTVRALDRIIVLAKGEIVEQGRHAELLEKKGIYYDLYSHQQL